MPENVIFYKCKQDQSKLGRLLSFLLHQISMSAPLIPVFVMKTLIAPIVKVPIAVPVDRDSLETVQYAKVPRNVI